MGRTRKPISEQTSHLTKSEIAEKEYIESKAIGDQEELYAVITQMFVNSVAHKEYQRILKNIEKMDIIGNLEKANLIGYANAYGCLCDATKQLKKEDLILVADNGNKYPNPLIKIQAQYGEEMRKYAKLCGLTIDSRLKAATHKTMKEKEEIADEFGDI